MHKPAMAPPRIFDQTARQLRFRRAAAMPIENQWIVERMAQELADRLDAVRRDFSEVALVGLGARFLRASDRLQSCEVTEHAASGPEPFEEDRLPLASTSQDLIIACGTLDSVNDLPGALILMRRALKPGGLFLAAMSGAGALPGLRQLVRDVSDRTGGPSVARFHPGIDVRAAGDLLGRAGFALPVAEAEQVPAAYRAFDTLIADIRGAGLSNALAERLALRRFEVDLLRAGFELARDKQGRFAEEFSILYLTGWAPESTRPV